MFEAFTILKYCLLLEGIGDELVNLGCNFNLLARSIKDLTLDSIHDGLYLQKFALSLITVIGSTEIKT